MNESDLLDHIRDRSADLQGLAGTFGEIVVGPGDDCAVIREPGGGLLLIGVDQLVEGRHFETGTDIDLIARKAVARAVSDIAAMGGRPCWGLATGVLPTGYMRGDSLFDAMAGWARHWNCPLIGGDIAIGSASEPGPLCLTVTVAGRMDEGVEPLLRSGARVGDELWLTGQVGGSFESGWHLRFEPRVEAGVAAASSGRVHAAIDLSDGLGRDAARVGCASGVRLEIDAARLPISHRRDDWRAAVSEGEDYELLIAGVACSRAARACGPESTEPTDRATWPRSAWPCHPTPFDAETSLIGPVGIVRACREGETPGATVIDPHGVEHDAAELGWDHGA